MDRPQNLVEFIDFISQIYGSKTSLQTYNDGKFRKYSYLQLAVETRKIASILIDRKVIPGDRAAILSENRPEWGLAYLGIIQAGGIVVPLDQALKTEDLAILINDSESKIIFISDKYLETGAALKKICPGLKFQFNLDRPDEPTDSLPFLHVFPPEKDSVATIVYTSGTTGNPKGVMLTHENLIYEMAAMAATIKIGPDDRTLSVLPLHHTFESTTDFLLPLFVGAEITYISSLKSSKILEAMQASRTTIFIGVPLLFQLIYNGIMTGVSGSPPLTKILFRIFQKICGWLPFQVLKKLVFGKIHRQFGGALRFFVTGGAAIDRRLILDFQRLGLNMIQGYGLTEAAPVITANRLEKNLPGSIGAPLPGQEVIIHLPDSQGIGELLARGPNIMKGYFRRPDLTAEVIRDGWLHTGDLVRKDRFGYYYIAGRLKDIIVTAAGQNVYPDEIEMTLARHPEIGEICVFGRIIENGIKKGSEEVFALIRPADNFYGELTPEKMTGIHNDIKKVFGSYNENCPTFKRVEDYKIVLEELPKTSTRKIKRNLVKEKWRDLM